MHVAYLINQYPKVSHTFVRREIRALEGLGLSVARFSVRSSGDELVDPSDIEENERTAVLLGGGAAPLVTALLAQALSAPLRFARALRLTLSIGWRSERGLLRNLAYLAEACLLRRRLVREGAVHVHAHFGTNSAAVAMLCHALGGPPYSFTVHGPEEFDKPLLIHLRAKIERAAFVVAISHYCTSQLYRQCGHEHWSKIHIVRCGLDSQFLRAEETPPPDTSRLVSVGRLSGQKGQLLLVDAVARLAQRRDDFQLVLVGDGEMRGELEARIRGAGLEDRVQITGWASNEEVLAQLREARCLVLPSFAEGLPVVIMEALALGRPVLTTYIAGIPELVNEECGWLVPAGSVDDLAEALSRALETPVADLRRMGAVGARRVAEQHDAAKEARRLADLFRLHAER